MKFKALALVAMMTAAPVFAADFDTALVAVDLAAIDLTTAQQYGTAVLANTYDPTTPMFDQNVALISQSAGDGSLAVIDQANGLGNFAVVHQDATNAPGVAYVLQDGNNQIAIIQQH